MNCHPIRLETIQNRIMPWICASRKVYRHDPHLIDMQSCNRSKSPSSHHSGI